MKPSALSTASHLLSFASLALLAGLAALIVLPHLAPLAGRQLVVMNGPAMTGVVPAGALVAVRALDAAAVAPTDLVTFRADDGRLLTRRVVDRSTDGASLHVEGALAGHGAVVPAHSVVGVAEAYLPWAGALLAFLSGSVGAMLVLTVLGSLVMAAWLTEDAARPRTGSTHRPRPAVAQPSA